MRKFGFLFFFVVVTSFLYSETDTLKNLVVDSYKKNLDSTLVDVSKDIVEYNKAYKTEETKLYTLQSTLFTRINTRYNKDFSFENKDRVLYCNVKEGTILTQGLLDKQISSTYDLYIKQIKKIDSLDISFQKQSKTNTKTQYKKDIVKKINENLTVKTIKTGSSDFFLTNLTFLSTLFIDSSFSKDDIILILNNLNTEKKECQLALITTFLSFNTDTIITELKKDSISSFAINKDTYFKEIEKLSLRFKSNNFDKKWSVFLEFPEFVFGENNFDFPLNSLYLYFNSLDLENILQNPDMCFYSKCLYSYFNSPFSTQELKIELDKGFITLLNTIVNNVKYPEYKATKRFLSDQEKYDALLPIQLLYNTLTVIPYKSSPPSLKAVLSNSWALQMLTESRRYNDLRNKLQADTVRVTSEYFDAYAHSLRSSAWFKQFQEQIKQYFGKTEVSFALNIIDRPDVLSCVAFPVIHIAQDKISYEFPLPDYMIKNAVDYIKSKDLALPSAAVSLLSKETRKVYSTAFTVNSAKIMLSELLKKSVYLPMSFSDKAYLVLKSYFNLYNSQDEDVYLVSENADEFEKSFMYLTKSFLEADYLAKRFWGSK